jgi:regulator of extracellular matrix RemA (YlzA/DUF370 family)
MKNLWTHAAALRFLICVVIFSLVSTGLAAAPKDDAGLYCRSLFDLFTLRPDPISVRTIKPAPEEVPVAGVLATGKWKPKRANETYLYIIDETGKKWISPEHITPAQNGAYVATHRSLVALKNLRYGEIIVKNSVVAIINNKSGTFAGNSTNLRYAHFLLQNSLGIEVPKNTALLDFSINRRDFAKVHSDRRKILAQAEKPEFKAMRDRWEKLLLRLYKFYPDKEHPGEIDSSFIDDIWDLYDKGEAQYVKELRAIGGYIATFTESIDFMVETSLKKPEQAKRIQDSLEKFIEKREILGSQSP